MNKSIKKKLINVASTLVIVLLAIFALFVIVSRIQNRVMFVFGKATVWVVTESMEDTIPARSYILIEKITDAENEIGVGDIITFYSTDDEIKGKLNTHEVIEKDKENGCFKTKGKNNVSPDSAPVPYANVVGRYVRNLPVLSVVGRFLMSVPGFIIVTLAMLAMICAVYLPDIVRACSGNGKSEDEKEDEHEKELQRRIAEEVERLKQQDKTKQEQDSSLLKQNKTQQNPQDNNKKI